MNVKGKFLGLLGAVALCVMVTPGTASATNILINPGFETGILSPWVNSVPLNFCGSCAWVVTSTDAHTGTNSATITGNRLILQTFSPIATSLITQASLWLRMPGGSPTAAAIYFGYSDGSSAEFSASPTSAWAFVNMTGNLAVGKNLVAFGVYGCNGCGGVGSTFADDFVIDAAVAAVPEPGTLALVGLGVLGAAARIRRRRQ